MAKRRPSGDGMVRKREDGRWEGRIVVGHKENGDSIFRYVYADTQKELTTKLRQNIDAYQGVDLTEESRMTLSEWLDRWLEQMSLTLRPDTLKRYRGDIGRHVNPAWGGRSSRNSPLRICGTYTVSFRTVDGSPPPRSKPRPLSHHCPRHPRRPPPGPPSGGRPGADAQQPCQTRETS